MGVMQSSADEVDAEGLTPLMRAAADGAGGRVLRCLVAARADVGARDSTKGRTALYLAASFGHAEAVEALARLGGDVNATAEPGAFDCTPMYIAAQEGHTAAIEALGRLGADVNRASKDGRTPVYAASRSGHAAVIEALGRMGADVNRANNNGWTPLGSATHNGHAAAVETLLRLGAYGVPLAAPCGAYGGGPAQEQCSRPVVTPYGLPALAPSGWPGHGTMQQVGACWPLDVSALANTGGGGSGFGGKTVVLGQDAGGLPAVKGLAHTDFHAGEPVRPACISTPPRP